MAISLSSFGCCWAAIKALASSPLSRLRMGARRIDPSSPSKLLCLCCSGSAGATGFVRSSSSISLDSAVSGGDSAPCLEFASFFAATEKLFFGGPATDWCARHGHSPCEASSRVFASALLSPLPLISLETIFVCLPIAVEAWYYCWLQTRIIKGRFVSHHIWSALNTVPS
jgi:hypothetical protein